MACSDARNLFRRLKNLGLSVEKTKGQHYAITDPRRPGPRVICSSTPGDWRSIRNVEAQVRRILCVKV